MSTYTDELTAEIERVTLKGNADNKTMRKIASIIFRMDQRLQMLENQIVVDEKPAPAVEAPVTKAKVEKTSARRVSAAKSED